MMAVSCTKAMLVVLFFMHVWWEANWKYVLTIPAAMMALFLVIMLVPDVGLRNRMVSQERAIHMARPSDLLVLEKASGDAGHGGEAH
jgi:cytochrome c oxidase subunit 4